MSPRWYAFGVALVTACFSPLARAQATQSDEVCRASLTLASAARDAERWAEVVATLEPLRDRCPYPGLFYALARSYLAIGRYQSVRVAAARFFELAGERISPEGRAEMESIMRDAQSSIATLSLSVAPSGARVLLDGAQIDASRPVEIDPGMHRVVVQHPRFQERVIELPLARAERRTETVVLQRSAPPAGRLRVLSTLENATIRVNGVVRGRGVLDIEMPPGLVSLSVEAPQHRRISSTVRVRDDELTTIRVELVSEPWRSALWWPYVVGGIALAGVATTLGVALGTHEYAGSMGRAIEVDLAR